MTLARIISVFVLGIFVSESLTLSASVPAEYQETYDALSASLISFNDTINSKWNGSRSSSTLWSAELLSVNVNYGEALLLPQILNRASSELAALKSMGIEGIVIPVHFPILTDAFYDYLGVTSYNANSFLHFYKNVSVQIHNAGMKLIVETHVMFGAYSNWDIAGYFETLDLAAYTAGRISTMEMVLTQLAPDFIQLQAERTTEVMNSGQTALNNYQTNLEFISALVDASLPIKGNCKVQVGVGTWDIYAFDTTDALLQMPIDSFDLHIYPIFGYNLNTAISLLDKARAAGIPTGITECWLSKAKDESELAEIVAYKNAFSFFAPLDMQFLYAMYAIGNYYEMELVSGFYSQYYFAYLDYDTVMNEGCGIDGHPCSDMEILGLVAKEATQNYITNELTKTGIYFKNLIASSAPQSPIDQGPEQSPFTENPPDSHSPLDQTPVKMSSSNLINNSSFLSLLSYISLTILY